MKVILLVIAAAMTVVSGKSVFEIIEEKAFAMCESDGDDGLTWAEVESCEVSLGQRLLIFNIPLPSKADFEESDCNNDGVLFFNEWLCVNMKKCYDDICDQ